MDIVFGRLMRLNDNKSVLRFGAEILEFSALFLDPSENVSRDIGIFMSIYWLINTEIKYQYSELTFMSHFTALACGSNKVKGGP